MDILFMDDDIIVCVKPCRVLSTDEPGGLPELLRNQLLDENADIRTVHRLDRVVSGLIVVARNAKAASILSGQVRDNSFTKEYLAVVHGIPEHQEATWEDQLWRDKARKMTFVFNGTAKPSQWASLSYHRVETANMLSLVSVLLHTGRTHQIRVQFSSRGFPLVGERKYSENEDDCELALFSHRISFLHPRTRDRMTFTRWPKRSFRGIAFKHASRMIN